MPTRLLPSVVAAALAGLHALACSFEAKVSDPDFTIVVPALPDIALKQQAPASPASAPRWLGDDGTYKVAVALSAMPQGISARECAGTGLRAILSQPGMPHRDSVYRAPLNAHTFLVLYVFEGSQPTLHAHLLSVAGDSHCTDVHFSRPQRAGEDVDDWRSSFSGAHIDKPAR